MLQISGEGEWKPNGTGDYEITIPDPAGKPQKLEASIQEDELTLDQRAACANFQSRPIIAAQSQSCSAMKHYLDFEKPIVELQRKLDELRKHPETHSSASASKRKSRRSNGRLEETRKNIFTDLTPWQRVQLARHPKRPFALDYFTSAFTEFDELHGDRLFSDDRAIVGGIREVGRTKVVVIGTQKGRDTKENIKRNFGSAHPEGYRKAMRVMKLADKFGLPMICSSILLALIRELARKNGILLKRSR